MNDKQPPLYWIAGAPFGGQDGGDVKLTSHLHPVSGLEFLICTPFAPIYLYD